ncbi:hypothetical protein TD95_005006 [Thielaviopsis punctulata]|uniref:Rhodopsin domain-containing protein n=1 Tax=Thielaviopsis punctulata TaxID=72032 RepID=A0A0F4ZAJ8_9PEZI|nr:hypothetical protein TD95_005006 [Thielaviopsis punctulata]
MDCVVAAAAESACEHTDIQSARNLTATACHEPLRDRSDAYKDLNIILGSITGFFILLRFFSKIFIINDHIYADDWMALFTFFSGIPGTVINVVGVAANGLGRDVWTLGMEKMMRFIQYLYAMELIYFTHIGLLKTTLLLFYLRIFPIRKIRLLLIGTLVFNGMYTLAFLIAGLLQCRPMNFYWTQYTGARNGHCFNINALVWSQAAIGIVLDLWMLALPLSQLRHLKLHWKKKVGVALMFFVGTFITVISIVRLQSLIHFANSHNPTWDNFLAGKWSTIEVNVGIICSCMPSMRLVLVRCFPIVFGSTVSRSRSGSAPVVANGSYHPGQGLRITPKRSVSKEGYLQSSEAEAIVMSRSYMVEVTGSSDDTIAMNDFVNHPRPVYSSRVV